MTSLIEIIEMQSVLAEKVMHDLYNLESSSIKTELLSLIEVYIKDLEEIENKLK